MAKNMNNSDADNAFDASSQMAASVPAIAAEEGENPAIPVLEIPNFGDSTASEDAPHGQFSGDDIEFESWMFDAGDGKGVVASQDDAQFAAQAAHIEEVPSPVSAVQQEAAPDMLPRMDAEQPQSSAEPVISGHGVPLPDFSSVFVADQGVPAAPEMQQPAAARPVDHSVRPTSPADWNDQMLASVEDFSSVLLSLGAATAPTATKSTTPTAQVPVVENIAPAKPRPTKEAAPEQTATPAPVEESSPVETPPLAISEVVESPFAGTQVDVTEVAPQEIDAVEISEPPMSPPLSWDAGAAAPLGAPDIASAEDLGMLASAEGAEPDLQWLAPDTSYEQPPEISSQSMEAVAEDVQPLAAEPETFVSSDVYPAVEVPDLDYLGAGRGIVPDASPDMPELGGIGTETPEETDSSAEAAAWSATPDSTALQEQAPVAFTPPDMVPDIMTEVAATTSDVEGLPGVPEGGLNGEDIEFESWMFNEGSISGLPELPKAGQFAPVIGSIEEGLHHEAAEYSPAMESVSPATIEANLHLEAQAQAEAQASHIRMESVGTPTEGVFTPLAGVAPPMESTGTPPSAPVADDLPLPFWLQDGMGSGYLSGALPALDGQSFPSTTLEAGMMSEPVETYDVGAASLMEAQDEQDAVEEFNFTELPPIEPFDFSMLQNADQSEELGFRTEELVGGSAQGGDPMMATANLDVLAELMGKDGPPSAGNAAAQATAPSPAQPAQENPPQAAGHTPGWTATETSKLSSENLTGPVSTRGLGDFSTGFVDNPGDPGGQELGVSPFDMSSLAMEPDEVGTGFLNTSNIGYDPNHVSNKIFTGTLFTDPNLQSPEYWDAPEWISSMTDPTPGVKTSDLDTSRFGGGKQDDETLSTQLMGRNSSVTSGTEEDIEDDGADIFRARVSRFKVKDDVYRHDAAALSSFPSQPLESYSVGSGSGSGAVQPQPILGTGPLEGAFTTGPLAPLRGFEALQELAAARPNEHGTHMALAIAYAQAGHTEHALYEYHNLLQKRDVPAPLLAMIESQITDLGRAAAGSPRFHQVRGDVLMKQGRYVEAIEEYNKIK